MLIKAYQAPDNSFHWLDVIDPTGTELEQLYNEYDLHQVSIQDFLDPKHLPKYERIEDQQFIILRSYDEKSKHSANTIRELTRKIAIFIGKNFIITLHRRDLSYINHIRDHWISAQTPSGIDEMLPNLLNRIILGMIETYNRGLLRCENDLERLESSMFKNEVSSLDIREKFVLKRKAFIFKRLLKITQEILPKMKLIGDWDPSALQDLTERTQSGYFESDDILEYVNGLITLHLSLASHKTNEVIRVLTVFSVFFLPLTFLVGVYGMNFKYMPELNWHYGYPAVWIVLLLISGILFIWFRRRGFLR